MSKSSNNLIIYNGYPLSVVVAVLLHSVVLALLLYLQGNSSSEALELVQPTVITALFLDENPQIRNEQNLERRRVEQIENQRREREEAQRQQELEEQRQQEQERLENAAREEEARQAAIRREEAAQREAAERAQALERQQEEERERQREQERREAEEQQRREQQRQRELDAEAARQAEAAAEGARTELQLVQSAMGLIQQIVQESWSRPPSARNGMRAILRIQMLPTGEVTEAAILESSGDAAFDRSAENAVYRAAPFTELQALPIRLFNQNFRSLQLVFQPEDLLN